MSKADQLPGKFVYTWQDAEDIWFAWSDDSQRFRGTSEAEAIGNLVKESASSLTIGGQLTIRSLEEVGVRVEIYKQHMTEEAWNFLIGMANAQSEETS